MSIELNQILTGDCRQLLKGLPDESIHCIVTSPPYFGLRDYGHNDQIGLEETPAHYVAQMVEVFNECKRVLRSDGTLWLNLGDSYAGGGGASGHNSETKNLGAKTSSYGAVRSGGKTYGLKPKDLIGIPWMVAFALRDAGWYLRQDIIWNKPNPMPESVTDRCTKAHEYIFLFSKSQRYHYDHEAIKQDVADASIVRLAQQIEKQKGSDRVPGKTNGRMKAVGPGRNPRKGVDTNGGNQGSENGIPAMAIHGNGVKDHSGYFDAQGNLIGGGKANKKSVWTVTTKPFKDAHYAVFPPELIIDCIKAGCPENGIVLDPFGGSGTTAEVARKLNRNYIIMELNPDHVQIAKRRLSKSLGMFQ